MTFGLEKPILKYHKAVVYLPNLVRAQPNISAENRARAAESPPWPVPQHCKPWVDGQTAGYAIKYGFLTPITIERTADDGIAVGNYEQLFAEAKVTDHIDSFAPGYFSFSTGYTLKTPPRFVTLILPSDQGVDGYEPLTGIVETDWFPKEIFIAAKLPPFGRKITFNFDDILARILVVPRQESVAVEQMDEAESAEISQQADDYRTEEATTDARWTAATGHDFTHVYKQRSKAFKRTLNQPRDE